MKTSRVILFILCLLLIPCKAFCQNDFGLSGKVLNDITRTDLVGSLVEVLDVKDSSLIDSVRAKGFWMSGNRQWYTADYNVWVPRRDDGYILRFTMDGYEPLYMNVSMKGVSKRKVSLELEPALMKRIKHIDLDGVTVTATKVKFHYRGDTLVYNADAFQLAEGSMLDALVRQLPGAEFRDNGQIYVNGRFVEDLLLNGKDFFSGNNQIMLDNLPAYTVKEVKVYDKLGRTSEFLGHDVGDKRYVMDVNLKKQYSIGYMGNIEVGGGTKDRYLGRLFAMRFTDHSRLSVYGNINNLNDNRNPGENDGWSPSDMIGGQTTQRTAGLDYSIDDRYKRYELNGNAQFEHSDNNTVNNTNRTNFLEGGDTYDRIVSSARNHNLALSTSHRFYFKFKNADLELKPNFSYSKYDNRNGYSSLTLSRDFTEFGKAQLDSMFTPGLGSYFMQSALNRNLRNSMAEGHSLQGSLSAHSTIRFKKSSDWIELYADASYRNSSDKTFDRNLVVYYSGGQQASTDFRNRYYDNMPDHGYRFTGKASYGYSLMGGGALKFSYQYERNYTSRRSSLFRLDQLEDWGEDTQHGFGSLPSVDEYMRVMDASNSYDSRQYDNTHSLEVLLNISRDSKKWHRWAQVRIPVSYLSRTLHYTRGSMDTTFTKRTAMLASCHGFYQARRHDGKGEFWFQYTVTPKAPDMTMYLNIHDTTDPLNTTMGNPDLKNSYMLEFLTHYTFTNPQKGQQLGLQLLYRPTLNDIAMGYTYDRATGRRTYRPANVSGNWLGSLMLYGSSNLNKKGTLSLSGGAGPKFRRSADLIGVEGATEAGKSIVKTMGVYANLNVEYKMGQSSIRLVSDCNWGRTTGTRESFNDFSSADFHYGATAKLQLPWKLQLSTDLTMYSRRGYANSEMNTDDLVWNARLSRPFLKGKLIALIDGFDILGQLNNVTRTVNAQGIEEVYSNVIPRYVMFHVIFKFNKSPKKRN